MGIGDSVPDLRARNSYFPGISKSWYNRLQFRVIRSYEMKEINNDSMIYLHSLKANHFDHNPSKDNYLIIQIRQCLSFQGSTQNT